MKDKLKIKILFVCMGNICRSPTAEGVFAHLVKEEGVSRNVHIDSAGTHAYHVGNPPDGRATEAALRRGIDLANQRARRVVPEDFIAFDYVLAMDNNNFEDLESICPVGYEEKLKLFLEFAPELNEVEVPDPYYGGGKGFERVLDMIEAASRGLLANLRDVHNIK